MAHIDGENGVLVCALDPLDHSSRLKVPHEERAIFAALQDVAHARLRVPRKRCL